MNEQTSTATATANFPMPTPLTDYLSKEDIVTLKADILKDFTATEQETFIRVCQRNRLDPYTKQLQPIARKKKVRGERGETKYVQTMSIVTTINGLCSIAVRTGLYDGCEIWWCGSDGIWKEEWISNEFPVAAKCVVYHKQRSHPEVAIAHFRAYAQTYKDDGGQIQYTDFWNRMPEWMIAKCAKALALRGAFPDQTADVLAEEELGANIESVPSDESKIDDIQKHDEKLKAQGVKIIGADQPLPTPEEALKPAFPEDEAPKQQPKRKAEPKPEPEKPVFAQKLQENFYPDQPAAPAGIPESPDDIPMDKPVGPPAWTTHVIKGVKSFKGRVLGSLDPNEWGLIEQKWIPAAHAQIKEATQDQLDDLQAFEEKIAHDKVAKPW